YVDTHGNVARLLVNRRDYGTGVGVKTIQRIVVSDGSYHSANQGLEIDICFGGDFTGDDNQSGSGQRLAGHTAVSIFLQTGIEDGVGNLVGNFVRMSFGYRLRGKQITLL